MIDYYKDVLFNKYALFTGRARRSEFWNFTLVNFLISLVLQAVAYIGAMSGISILATIGSILAGIYGLAVLIPGIAAGVRRLQDTGKSGLFLLLGLIPVIGLALIYFLAQDSQPGSNQYGPNPKGIEG